MKKQWLIIGLMAMSAGSTVFAGNTVFAGQTEISKAADQEAVQQAAAVQEGTQAAQITSGNTLDEASIVPVNYQNKIFANGEYEDLSYVDYKVYSQENTVYLPLRLMAKLISTPEEYWEAKWDSKKPDEVILQCTYMESIGMDGWSSTGEIRTIKLNVGSTQAAITTKDDEEQAAVKNVLQLSKSPKKINGSICLPLRAIGELLGKQVNYKNGLVFISDKGISLESPEMAQEIQVIKKNLENKQKAVQTDNYVAGATNYNGVNYYAVNEYNEQSMSYSLILYSQKGNQKPQVIKKISKDYDANAQMVGHKLYYIAENKNGRALECLDLAAQKTEVVWQIGENQRFERIAQIIPKEDALYVVTHDGDLTMGSEELYKIVNQKGEAVGECHGFGSVLINGDMIYHTEMDNWLTPQNIGCYDQKTKQSAKIGNSDYVYDMAVSLVNGELGSYGICSSAVIQDGKLYTLAYKNESAEGPVVCSIDLATNEQKNLTLPAEKFWLSGNHIYYIETATRYLKTVDLEGNGEKTLVSTAVKDADLKNNCLYYTKQVSSKEQGSGLYVYGLGTGVTTTINEAPIKDFKVTGKRVAYITGGYNPGIYKWAEGKNTLLESKLIGEYTLGEGCIFYKPAYEKEGCVRQIC